MKHFITIITLIFCLLSSLYPQKGYMILEFKAEEINSGDSITL